MHGKVADAKPVEPMDGAVTASLELTDVASQDDLIAIPRPVGRPRGNSKNEVVLDKWTSFLDRATDLLAVRFGLITTAARSSLGISEEKVAEYSLKVSNDSPVGITCLASPLDMTAILYCMVLALNADTRREAGLEEEGLPSLEWSRAWLALLEDTRAVGAALALDSGLDPICGTALGLGFLVVPYPEFISTAKTYTPISFFHSLPEKRVEWQRDAFAYQREIDKVFKKHLEKLRPKLFFAGLTDGMGWRGSANWEERFRRYNQLSNLSPDKSELPAVTDYRHLRLLCERTGSYLRRTLPDEPQYWSHLVW